MCKHGFTIAILCFSGTLAWGQPASPCALLNKAAVEQAVGQSIGDPKPNAHNASVCDIKVGGFGTLGLMRQQQRPGETPDKIMAELKKRNIPVTEAPGIGDRSFFASPGYGMTQLNTFKGSSYLIITLMIPGGNEAKQKAIAEKVMKAVLTKL